MEGRYERPLLFHAPFNVLYLIMYCLRLLAVFPFYLFTRLLTGSWPHVGWTLRQTVLAYLVREVTHARSRVRSQQYLSLAGGREGDRFKVIRPAPSSFYRRPLNQLEYPDVVGGTWYPKPIPDLPDPAPSSSSVLLHFHGGAFVVGDGREKSLGFLCSTLLRFGGVTSIFAPQYRLSAPPGCHQFPAALQDALTSYLYLVQTLRVPATCITISGDSAGGNLVIGLIRYLMTNAHDLGIPMPSKAVLVSPWVSPKSATGPNIVTITNQNYLTDYLPHSHLHWGAVTYAGDSPISDPYISPLGHPFYTSIPILVAVGGSELMELDIACWSKEMAAVANNNILLIYDENAPHDTLLMGEIIGWENGARKIAFLIATFIKASDQTAK